MVVPSLDLEGRIVALKVRADDAAAELRYTAVSSRRLGGASAAVNVHVPIGARARWERSGVLWITEGELKADVCTALEAYAIVGIPGVSMWKTAALDVADAQFSSLKRGSDEAHAALATLGWDGNSYPEDWAKTTAAHYKAVREALGVPAGKPIVAYAQHAAKGMQALATLGWQDGSPVEWATKRAAAEADLRGALAEAELVGNDHAAMVRQLWGNLRSKSAQHLAAIEERNAQVDECAILRTVITEREGRIELAEKRLSTWRAWAVGMCPATPPPANMTDEDLRAAMTFVSVADYNRAIKAVQDELARQRSLVSVMVDIKRRLIALKDLSS
jgi:hypothetical protein